jgi:hypothetical protein
MENGSWRRMDYPKDIPESGTKPTQPSDIAHALSTIIT